MLLTITDITTGTTYPTIAAAVAGANAGNTIVVGAGTYDETVNINKPLTLEGAQSGVDARTRSGAAGTESIVDGAGGGFDITANNVTVDGFTFEGTTNPNPVGFGVAVAATVSGAQVLDNIIENNIAGMYLNGNGTSQTVVKQNLFENNNNPGAGSGNGIYSDGGAQNILIDNNAFAGNTNGAIVFAGSAGTQSNITISNNQITSGAGIALANVATTTITGNTINGTTGTGIGIAGGDSGITVASNSITDSGTTGVNITTAIAATPNANIAVNFNRLFGNKTAGVAVAAGASTGNVDATENWWGGNAGPNTTGNDSATGAVTDTPFLVLQATPSLATIGVGGKTTVTADLTHDSTGAVAAGSSHFPDGVPIAFAGTGGTVSPASAPTAAATAATSFTATAAGADNVAVTLDNQIVNVPVQASVVTLAPTSLPNATVGKSYDQTVTASGGTGTYTYSLSAGALPAGLAFDTTTGAITGTPTATGTSDFSITATDTSGATVTQPYSLTINPVVTTGPTVTNLQRLGFHAQPTTFVLTFSTAMNPTSAQNINNYTLVPIINGTPGTPIALSSAVYDATNNTVTLTPTSNVYLYGQYQLTVNGTPPTGLTDTSGDFLAGANGQPGTNYVKAFGAEILAGPNMVSTTPTVIARSIHNEWTNVLASRFAALRARAAATHHTPATTTHHPRPVHVTSGHAKAPAIKTAHTATHRSK